jgi:hypothetical protein
MYKKWKKTQSFNQLNIKINLSKKKNQSRVPHSHHQRKWGKHEESMEKKGLRIHPPDFVRFLSNTIYFHRICFARFYPSQITQSEIVFHCLSTSDHDLATNSDSDSHFSYDNAFWSKKKKIIFLIRFKSIWSYLSNLYYYIKHLRIGGSIFCHDNFLLYSFYPSIRRIIFIFGWSNVYDRVHWSPFSLHFFSYILLFS